MAHEFIPTRLHGGGRVVLVKWEDEAPPQHGAELQAKAWNPSHPRKGVGFYDSTVEYMRNDWAQAHMSPTHVSVGKQDLLLFHNAATDTWHSSDALDIDHARQWKDHLSALRVDNYADANRAYNDVTNLRLLPAPINRARASFETMLETHGGDSAQSKAWVKKHFAFDPDAPRPAYDEERDLARRTAATTDREWDPSEGRKGLKFDAGVLNKWYDGQLKQSYAATVRMTSPTTGQVADVPLFRCGASQQLCTRDALDIDHRVPFEILAVEMVKYAEGGKLSKANAADVYNETSNLRLVARGANSSHEWELDRSGGYRDKQKPERPGEFDGFIDRSGLDAGMKAGAKAAPAMSAIASAPLRAVPSAVSSPPLAVAAPQMPSSLFGAAPAAPSFAFGSSQAPSQAPSLASGSTPASPSFVFAEPQPTQHAPSPSPFGAAAKSAPAYAAPPLMGTAAPVAPLMSDGRHPDHPLYAQALRGLQTGPGAQLNATQQQNAASSLAWVAKANQMTAIDQVTLSDGRLYAVQNPGSPARQVAFAMADLAIKRSVEQNTSVIDKLPTPAKAQAQGQSTPQPMKY